MELLRKTLRSLRQTGAFRNLSVPMAPLDFSSNDYLGMASNPQVRERLCDYLQSGGHLGATGSRLLRGNHEAHESCEAFLASAFKVESALLFSSGYLANLGVLGALTSDCTEFFSDSLNHASLIDGMRGARRTIFRHNDMNHLESVLSSSQSKRKVIVTESLFSMEGDFAPLTEIVSLARRFGAWLVVDEAHATGLFGDGRGRLKEIATSDIPLIAIHTAGKALGAMGAFVLSSRELRDFFVNRARTFIFSTALSPLLATQIEVANRIVLENPKRRDACLANSVQFRREIGLASVPSPIVPILVPGNERVLKAAETLQMKGFDVRAIRAPTVAEGSERLRIAIKSFHSKEELLRLATAVEELRCV